MVRSENHDGTTASVEYEDGDSQSAQLQHCRQLLSEIKGTGVLFKLLLDGTLRSDGLFCQLHVYPFDPQFPKQTATEYCLDRVGDLVDNLRMIWGRGFPVGRPYIFGCGRIADYFLETHRFATDEERYAAELDETRKFLETFATKSPNLMCLQLQIPAYLYPESDVRIIAEVLPGHGWKVERGPDMVGPYVTLLRRVFTRE